eukprot:TRINITY_DN10665_c0_g1_i1.p1 TRINITY_DN10665_c0_g1~~TRINITY_DN10665_c0_g1_i1.p1  ORF type:complete len:834 (+),score=119.74 TRINITY_DN10665_c0_g1_i1:88-2502(+)
MLDCTEFSPWHFQLPKSIDIKDKKLGILYRVLQVGFVWLALTRTIMNKDYLAEHAPIADSFTIWGEAGDAALLDDSSVAHCSDLSPYYYVYSASWIFHPSRCKRLTGPVALQKGSGTNWVFIPTFIRETTRWAGYGSDCTAAAEANCKVHEGVWDYKKNVDECSCVSDEAYFGKNPEFNKVAFIYGYNVHYTGGAFQRGVSTSRIHVQGHQGSAPREQEAEMETRFFSKRTGKPCNFGGREVWTVRDVSQGLSITIVELLNCVGLDLDKQYDDYRSKHEMENQAPYLRQTGVVITAYMVFQNEAVRDGFETEPGVWCQVLLDASLAWNSQTSTETLAVPGPAGNYSVQVDRYSWGISVNFVVQGSFGHFDLNTLLGALVDIIVLQGIPRRIMLLVCLLCLGVRSTVYRNATQQPFSLPEFVCGSVARKLSYAVAFQTFSKQHGSDVSDLGAMTKEDFTRILSKFLWRHCKGGDVLDQKEIEVVGSFLYEAFDMDRSGGVDMDEWITVAGNDEPMQLGHLATMFDVDRKLGIGERIFNDGITVFIKATWEKYADLLIPEGSNNTASVMDEVPESSIPPEKDILEALELKLQAQVDALEASLDTRVEEKFTKYAQELSAKHAELLEAATRPWSMANIPAPSQLDIQADSRILSNSESTLQRHERQLQGLEKSLHDLERDLHHHTSDSQRMGSLAVAENFHDLAEDQSRALQQATGALHSLLQEVSETRAGVNDDKLIVRAVQDKFAALIYDVAEIKGRLRSLDTEVGSLSEKIRSQQQAQMSLQPLSQQPQAYSQVVTPIRTMASL